MGGDATSKFPANDRPSTKYISTSGGSGGGSGTVTSVAVNTANGVSGTVANSTTTPVITLVLGAITPTSIAASGTVHGSNLSGTNTGDQTITLTGDTTGSGSGSFVTTIAANAVTLSKFQQIATASILGRSTAGTGNVEVLSASATKTLLSLNNVENTALSTWVGSASLKTVGTITTGIWHGTAIADTYIASATAWNAKETPLIFSTGLTRVSNTITVNNSQSISTLSNLTTNGFIKTSGGTGTLSVDTSTYLTGNQTITLSGDISGSGSTAITTVIGNNKVTLAMMATVATASILGRNTAGTGNVEVLSAATTKSLLSLNNVENTALSTWAGTSNITTLGTITTGTWHGTAIGDTYISSASTWNAKESALTFSTGLTRSTNTITVNTSQNIDTLSNLTTNGFIKTSGGTGALSVDTSTYLTGNQSITLSGDISGSGTTAITTAIGSGKVTNTMLATTAKTSSFGLVVKGNPLTTGSKGFWVAPAAGTITKATLIADVSGSAVIDIKKSTYSGFPSTSSICASAKPTLSSAQKSQDSTLTGWTTSFSAGDVFEFNLDSFTTVGYVMLSVEYTRT